MRSETFLAALAATACVWQDAQKGGGTRARIHRWLHGSPYQAEKQNSGQRDRCGTITQRALEDNLEGAAAVALGIIAIIAM